MEKYLDVLGRCPLFAGIEKGELQSMLACLGACEKSFAKGRAILEEGTPATEMGVVLSGRAQVEQSDYFGNRSILASVFPGELFAESFACAGVSFLPVQVRAEEESKVLLVDCQRMLTTCSHACAFHGRMIENLLRIVAHKNLQLHRKAEILSRRTTREKVLTYLTEEARRSGSDTFEISFNRQQLADYLAVDRSGLSAEMSKMKKEGMLDYRKNRFHLLKAE